MTDAVIPQLEPDDDDESFERMLAKHAEPTPEVAAAVAFLAGDASTYITGEALQINGGIYFI